MKIERVQQIKYNFYNPLQPQKNSATQMELRNENLLMENLNSMASANKISFGQKHKPFEIGLSPEELKKRTGKSRLSTIKLLAPDAPEYLALAQGDKQALKHLVRAAYLLEPVFLKLDDKDNIPFKEFLKSEVKKGNPNAKKALVLFNAQKGINAIDAESHRFSLMKGRKEAKGKGFYPTNLSQKHFQEMLIKMLEDGKIEEVKKILNQRSIVKVEKGELKAIDYTVAFAKEYQAAAKELLKAAEVSTNPDFSEYLKLEAKALVSEDPMSEAIAEQKWALLQDTPLEFTITKESYSDEFSTEILKNPKLKELLDKHSITPRIKDSLGFRVGIVHKKGTEMILKAKRFLPHMAQEMPFKNEYAQFISEDMSNVKQTMVDVDLVVLGGDGGAYRGGITLAENLPNDDKLSIALGGGRRNVYHRQIRKNIDPKRLQKWLDNILVKNLHQFYENEADHWITIGHENTHSLGPKNNMEALGKYAGIIEENKADMGAIATIDKLKELGLYDEKQRKQMIVTFVSHCTLKAKPKINQPHRVRTVMQLNYFIKHGAVKILPTGHLDIDIDKVVPTARKMLEEIIRVQLSNDFATAEKFVMDNFVWTDGMEKLARKSRKINKKLNGRVVEKLAQKLLRSI